MWITSKLSSSIATVKSKPTALLYFTSFSEGHFINSSIIGQVVSKIRQAFSGVVGYILLGAVKLCLVVADLLKIL